MRPRRNPTLRRAGLPCQPTVGDEFLCAGAISPSAWRCGRAGPSNMVSSTGTRREVTEVDDTPSRGPKSWPWITATFVVVTALFAPAAWLPGTSEPRAEAVAIEFESALLGLRDGLAESQQALLVLTDPMAEPEAFRELLPALSQFQATIRVARDRSAKPLPHAWPLAPSTPFEALQPSRNALARAAEQADEVLSALTGTLNYRAAIDEVFVIDALPVVPPADFERFKTHMGDVVAAQEALLDELPRFQLLREHTSEVRAAVRRLDTWAEAYVHALWIGETPAAASLLEELRSTRAALDASLSTGLSAFRADFEPTITALAQDVENALAAFEIAESAD